jgi:hypothetical protein
MPRRNDDLYYEDDFVPPESLLADRGIHLSTDGARVVTGLLNVRPQKRQRADPGQPADTYADWTPVPDDDLEEVHAVADTVTSLDVVPEDEETLKRKRYKSSVSIMVFSVSFFFFWLGLSEHD